MRGDIQLERYCALFWSWQSDVGEVNCLLFNRAARLEAPPLPRCTLNHSRTEKQNGGGKAERGEKTVCNIKTMCVTRLHRSKRYSDARIALKISLKCYTTYVLKTLYSFRDTDAS